MNDSRVSKTVRFEGAGWADADTSKATDMLNCRVRTTFINDKGQKIYLEMGCYDNRKGASQTKWHRGFDMPWHINDLFIIDKKERNHFGRHVTDIVMEFSKKNVLSFINRQCDASFEDLETINWRGDRDSCQWDGFSHTGKKEDDFHNEGEV